MMQLVRGSGDALEAISDASDWPCSAMREFERKLRCPICHDFIRTCLLLRPCSHNCTSVRARPQTCLPLLILTPHPLGGSLLPLH